MKTFLLGAGASKSYSSSPSGVRMPIAKDFFETFDKLDISANTWVLQEGIIGYLASKGISDAHSYLRSGIDIEEFHSRIASDLEEVIASPDPEQWMWPYKAYNELLFLFASVLNEIQNGPISEPHRKIARLLTEQDTVITFNWDTLMDRALDHETSWCVDSGYEIEPSGIFENEWRACAENGPAPARPTLLKLHGSTNWLTAYPTRESGRYQLSHSVDPSTVYVFKSADGPYACYAGRFMPGYQPFSCGYYPPNLLDIPSRTAPEGHLFVRTRLMMPFLRPEGTASREGLVSAPLIIPPVRNKTYDLYGGLFAGLWQRAATALVEADEIVIIGYSFPPTDLRSHQLFVQSFMRRETMPYITIIDPNPDRVASMFRLELGITADRLQVVPAYFSDAFDLSACLRS